MPDRGSRSLHRHPRRREPPTGRRAILLLRRIPSGPRPNNRVTKGKLEGQHFAVWANDEEPEANPRGGSAATTPNRG
jgi:hypothetical protein